ncbi:hypothetical protein MAPG_06944 [Magnaporthiopsis poae ATCC 64411]|uniref:Extracellular membrane protein CFEM domain-containing protein n=1 Tax=Magnaporthiopsis poae (strain ATCC 64411 / 73-15) TaxID=644358 RepID=A0A0C4E3E5_MAGP6|nr:hypothetical protein MAPG_06944 [Magnaporthiopsis poae ATCC 64411]
MHDLGCQCQQQARMMAAAEGCVAKFCPAVAYQSVIDGVMAMCACAVGVATAQPSATLMGSFTATATVVSGMTVVASGLDMRSSIAPLSLSATAAAVAAPSEAPSVQRPRPGGGDKQRPLVATPVSPQELQEALGITPTKPAEAGAAPRQGMRVLLAASLVASAAVLVVPFL